MLLTCFYDKSNGRIKKLVRSTANASLLREDSDSGEKGIVRKCPKEVYNLSSNEIKDNYRVCNESNGFVEIEYGKK